MNILTVASEGEPFVKTGGLADVFGSLPSALASFKSLNAYSIAQVLPKYSQIAEKEYPMELLPGRLQVPVGKKIEEGAVWRLKQKKKIGSKNILYYFIENNKYFHRSSLYQDELGDFEDNDERFIFLSKAVFELAKQIGFKPELLHCHDWQTGMVPAYLKTLYANDPFFSKTKAIFTIHNIAYQGLFPKETFNLTGLDWEEFVSEKCEYYGKVSFLKAGIVYADKVTTVSPTYAKEIRQDHHFGRGMEGILNTRASDLVGILNGLDYSLWDPAKDPFICKNYSFKIRNFLDHKMQCKEDLQKNLKLPQKKRIPLIGIVSRLDPQKGLHRLEKIVNNLRKKDSFQWALLGVGDKKIKQSLRLLAKKFPKEFAVHFNFSPELAHKIYAGSDFFLMPSEFEPCGLSQMISMKYGTIPIATPTGGLLDSIKEWDPASKEGNGLLAKEISNEAIETEVLRAAAIYKNKKEWGQLVKNAMKEDFSWRASAKKYAELFENVVK
ncbi:MAG: glycogen synthase [Elusimicrobia bacterium]|nr:glycogen synthase [Elusimicrobiota bacterium]